MAFKKISSWMVTDAGRTFSYYTVGALSTGALAAHYLPQTLLLDKYQNIIKLYKNGFPVPLSQTLQNRFEKVLELLEIKDVEKSLYQPFHCFGFDVLSVGSSYTRSGCIIGLPINFTYTNPNTIDKQKLKINQESVIWDSEPAQNLLSSLVLSENAQLYAMAREVKYRQTPKPFIDTFLSVNTILVAYGVSKHINEKFNLYVKPLGLRLTLYCLVGLFSFGIYAMGKDMSQIYYEEKIDKELKKTNDLFIEGGREYYFKILERNKALRHLLGREGEVLYSVLGNENYFLRNKHMPLLQRKALFEDEMLPS